MSESDIKVFVIRTTCDKSMQDDIEQLPHSTASDIEDVKSHIQLKHQSLSIESSNTREPNQDEVENGSIKTETQWSITNYIKSFTKNSLDDVNKKTENSLCLQRLYAIFIIVLSIGIPSVMTIWPQHDVIIYPEYWYEPLVPLIFVLFTISSVNTITLISTIMKMNSIYSWASFFKLTLASTFGFLAPQLCIYVIWVIIFEYRYPMPFIGRICLTISYMVKAVFVWFLFPKKLRENKTSFRKRIIALVYMMPFLFSCQPYIVNWRG